MEEHIELQMSERVRTGLLLALAGGLLDAYTYVTRGGVFANAQTGNIVLLGVRACEGDWGGMLHRLLPILAFVAGVLAAEEIRRRYRGGQEVHWRQVALGLEIAVLLAVSFLPPALNGAANVAVSFVCAIQVESFRKMRGNAFATTMCTGNLRSGTEQFYQFLRTGGREHLEKAAQYGGVILCSGGGGWGLVQCAAGRARGSRGLCSAADGAVPDAVPGTEGGKEKIKKDQQKSA